MTTTFSPGDLAHARGRDWVVMPPPSEGLLALRPLSGMEEDMIILDPALELDPVSPASFRLPADARPAVQSKAALLAEALRFTLRRGAGPFRSAAQLAFEPRAYQLVPLLMALRLPVPRLLIADDVGIGKTIEAGLILREFIDRGEVDAFAVLCPPHLVEQWITELRDRFGIEAVAVTAASASRLERGLPLAQSLFDAHPHTVVSLDYIKSERRRDLFARSCPDFIIVDEAHACVGVHRGRQQRFALLSDLARKEQRAMVFLTATPHSGDEEAFARLLSLISPRFAALNFNDEKYRIDLARHFVQRRRMDIVGGRWGEDRTFPRHETSELAYDLPQQHKAFQDAVLDYCFAQVEKAGSGQRERRLAFWGTLALMRCVGSSPAAALSALRNRQNNDTTGERLEDKIYDDDGEDEDAVDIEPAALPADDDLSALISQAEALVHGPDPKADALIKTLKPLIRKGANPVIFCRFLATADHLARHLKKAFPKLVVESVTGLLTPDERRERVAAMAPPEGEENQRLLVATDCLSEGINLQQLFDMVVHYDLSWNPTRHQQREGRVDRFGQPAALVRSIMMFSPDSAIDGAVLDVILRKAEEIRKVTGVTVPLPEDRGPLTDALMNAMLLRRSHSRQLALDLRLDSGERIMDMRWRDVMEQEKQSRTRFAQNTMKPDEVIPEWEKAQELLGSHQEALDFIDRAMTRFGAPLEKRKGLLMAHVHGLEAPLRERLEQMGLRGSLPLAADEPVPAGATLISRAHPLTAALAEALVEASLTPDVMPTLCLGRTGAWPTAAVNSLVHMVLLRIRYKLTIHGRKERLLLAEEAALVAIRDNAIIASGEKARAMIAAEATHDLAKAARKRIIAQAHARLPDMLQGPLAEHVRARAGVLQEDHGRLRATGGKEARSIARVSVEPVIPPDVIGLFTLLPGED